ncbi:MAG: cupin domain-containing protein [Candidatus Marinimicrobia bacterium]|nr:cupin domain-containing protein [Candidatus Neomarinimicrobiota bacterium]
MLDLIVKANDLKWQDASESYMRGTQIKILREDEGGKTILLKIPPGFRQESHSHLRTEQHYVIQGAYEMGSTPCPEGTYQLIHKDSTHGPITSKAGAVILVIWH